MKSYWAVFLCINGREIPEIVLPQFKAYEDRSSGPIEFFLDDKAEVVMGREVVKWGKIRRDKSYSSYDDTPYKKPFLVKVKKPLWKLAPGLTPEEVIKLFKGLKDQVRRRNLQIKNLHEAKASRHTKVTAR